MTLNHITLNYTSQGLPALPAAAPSCAVDYVASGAGAAARVLRQHHTVPHPIVSRVVMRVT